MTFRHSGDLGDCVFFLPLLRAIGGKHHILLVDRNKVSPFTAPLVQRSHLIIPLLESHPNVASVSCSEEKPDVDMSLFRAFHNATTTLVKAQVSYYNSETGSSLEEDGSTPWLAHIKPDEKFKDRIIVARSPRYNNDFFPWREIVKFYGQRLLFIGLDKEHEVFCRNFGNIERAKVNDFHRMARIIAGAKLFIGNQSSPHAVAMGLGVPIISEVCLNQPDCIFNRDNVQYVANGACILKDGDRELAIENRIPLDMTFHREMCPPGQWQYPGLPATPIYSQLINLVIQVERCSRDEADRLIAIYNSRRCPEFFGNSGPAHLRLFKEAMSRAGLSFDLQIQKETTKLQNP